MVIPDFIAYPLMTWVVAAVWFHRHDLFGNDEEGINASKKSSR